MNRSAPQRWLGLVAGPGLVLLLGIFLLANPFSAVRTLALLVALDLALEGMDHIVNAPRYRVRWAAYLLGALYLVTGIVAVSWPGITLWALALIVGVGLVIGGGVQLLVVTLFHRDLPNRWVFLAMGVLTVLTGLLALSWPGATVLADAIVAPGPTFRGAHGSGTTPAIFDRTPWKAQTRSEVGSRWNSPPVLVAIWRRSASSESPKPKV